MITTQLKHFYSLTSFILLSACLSSVSTLNAQSIVINEFMAVNFSTLSDEDNDFSDWIEVYNYGSNPVSLENFGLSDNDDLPFKWIFPDTTIQPGAYFIIWASGKNRRVPGQELHTNFSISASGEEILLTNASGNRIDFIPPQLMQRDISFGKLPDGTGNHVFFYQPSPGLANDSSQSRTDLFSTPIFSHQGGLYGNPFNLSITHPDPGTVIVYTLDGSEPDINNLSGTSFMYKNDYPYVIGSPFGDTLYSSFTSKIFDSAIYIYYRSLDSNYFTNFNPTQFPMFYPPNPVRKGTVVRAKAYLGNLVSNETSHSYFVWPQGNPYDIPVISLKIQHNLLFDYYTGIYNAGFTFDTWRSNFPNGANADRPMYGNYWRRGPAWEYPLHVEFFEPDNFQTVINQNAGFRIHGNFSRNRYVKNLRLYARNQYDEKNEFEHDLFDDQVTDSRNPENTTYKRILLRGDGAGGPIYHDVVFNRLMQPVFKGMTRIKPAVHFINGEFWGLTAIRDRVDQFHYATHFNIDPDNIVEVECRRTNCHIEIGTPTDFQSYQNLRNYIIAQDLSNNTLFDNVAAQLSIPSFIDHMIIQIYSGDTHYERSFWKVRNPENPEYGDGKWRMYTQDFEQSLRTDRNWLTHWATQAGANDQIFGNLLENQGFKHDFINRFADLLNTAYLPNRFQAITDSVRAEVLPYLAEDSNRGPRPDYFRLSERNNLVAWGNTHHVRQKDEIRAHFNISGNYEITIDVSDTSAGYVRINTIDLSSETVGIDEMPYPWTGTYFNDIPITLIAKAKPGYRFTHWSGGHTSSSDSIQLTRSSNLSIQANFEVDPNPEDVLYFWLFSNTLPNNQPLDSILSTYENMGVDAVLHFRSCLIGYPFTNAHPMWRKASLERRNHPTPLNYRVNANSNISFENSGMRGLQIRQPFHYHNQESTIELDVPTTGKGDIKLSLAVENQSSAYGLIFEYFDQAQWRNTGLNADTFFIDASYRLLEVDFSQVSTANDNPFFRIRIRITGDDMESDLGQRININNLAIEGRNYFYDNVEERQNHHLVNIFPNPTEGIIRIDSRNSISQIEVRSLQGQLILRKSQRSQQHQLDISTYPAGMYVLKIQFNNGQEQTFRVLKQ